MYVINIIIINLLTQGLSSKLTVANLVGSSIRPRGKLDNWLELRDLEKILKIFLKDRETKKLICFFEYIFRRVIKHFKKNTIIETKTKVSYANFEKSTFVLKFEKSSIFAKI